ncbi:PAS domain S-box-containing protein [Malaciobacter marinus]|uniref:PAS domain S-box-containing protein n=1 Tax=Malaciobacter marinus TaxID=505249 RepID=A0AB36ZXG9_9BACT|nr:PAS domain-containing protein [Malaciobacter marinus]PPK60236.1 PAS domain S-box-containing protein [Malaciobacter marinus]
MNKSFNLIFNIIENLEAGILLINENGKIEYTNSYLNNMLGYNKDELINENIWKIDYFLGTSDKFKEKVKEFNKNRFNEITIKYIKKDNTILDCNCNISKIKKTDNNYFFLIIKIKKDFNKNINLEECLYLKTELSSYIKSLKEPIITIKTAINAFDFKKDLGLIISDDDLTINLQAVKNEVKKIDSILDKYK